MRIALVAMPWRDSTGPAMGLSNLKAIALEHPDTTCDIHYLNIAWQKTVETALAAAAARDGLPLNQLCSKILDLAQIRHSAEWMFALDAFPETQATADLYIDEYRSSALRQKFAYSEYILETAKLVRGFLEECLNNISWDAYDVIGFECIYLQLSPSLALAKRLKRAFPEKISREIEPAHSSRHRPHRRRPWHSPVALRRQHPVEQADRKRLRRTDFDRREPNPDGLGEVEHVSPSRAKG
ncbi:MAG: hypothetical protein HQL41_00810 [Alphaproteobacteria bacterium]|nr:hypothetical protein [Alphaproteobacteria bacterium]